VVLKQLAGFAFLRRPILALPLEEIGAEKAILITVRFGMSSLVEGHEQENIIPLDDESGLSPSDGPELESKEFWNLLARVVSPEFCSTLRVSTA
jgi:hypothetical protein